MATTSSPATQQTTTSSAAAAATTSSSPQSTTLLTSASRASPAAALTTPFVPPAKCLDEVSRFANTACMPPNWNQYWYGNVGYYSPAVCPQSYAVAASRPANVAASAGFGPAPEKGEVAVICCPSGYITVSNSASFCSSASSSAYAIQVRWQFTDIPHLQGITEMISEVSAMPSGGYSTITATSAPTGASSSSHSDGLSTGAKVAIGIFVPLAIISLFAGALMFFLRRRRRRLRAMPASPNLDKAAFHSHASSNTSVTLKASGSGAGNCSTTELQTTQRDILVPPMQEEYALSLARSPTLANRQSHISLSSAPDSKSIDAPAGLESEYPRVHRPQVSLAIPPETQTQERGLQDDEHGDTPLLPRAPSPAQFHPQVELARSATPVLQDYGYSRMQRSSREELVASPVPAFVAPLPPPTPDRPEPLRIRQVIGVAQPPTKTLRRASSTPSLPPVTEVESEDRYMAPPSTAVGEPTSWPTSSEFPEGFKTNSLTAATFPLSPGTVATPYSEMSPTQLPDHIAELEAPVEPLSIKPAKSTKSSRSSPNLAPSSPPRSKSAMERPLRLEVETLEPPQRCRSALDQSPVDRTSLHSDEIPFRPTTPQALPRVFSQKRTANPVAPRLNLEALPKLQPVPDYAGGDYGDTSGSAVDVQDEEMFRRVQERRMLEERERRLERAVDARYSWRGAHGGHRPRSQSFG